MAEKKIADLSFEEALVELETLVSRLEKGDVALAQAVESYERGAALKKHCETTLRAAQEKIEKIVLNDNQQPVGTTALDE